MFFERYLESLAFFRFFVCFFVVLSFGRFLVHAVLSGDCGVLGSTLKETGRGGGRVFYLFLRSWV